MAGARTSLSLPLEPRSAAMASPKPTSYVPTVAPGLRIALAIIFGGFAFLGATGFSLAAVTAMNASDPAPPYTTPFPFWVFIVHVGFGVLMLVPFLAFCVGHYIQSRNRPNR